MVKPVDASETKIIPQNPSQQMLPVEVVEGLLAEARETILEKQSLCLPMASLASLGAGVSSLIPAFQTVIQTNTVHMDGLYRLANASVGDTLKVARNGNFWGAFKTADGASKFAQLQAADAVSSTTTTVMPPNPATVMMAAALFSIDQKLDSILEMERKILSFLQSEKESEIEADVETLSSILSKYKMNWDNVHYIASNHKLAIDIQRTARKNLRSYQKEVSNLLASKKLLMSQAKVNTALKELLRSFKYYRLSLYIFAMASFVEIMLSGDFKEENLLGAKTELEQISGIYRELFDRCSAHLEQVSGDSIEVKALKGLGAVSSSLGAAIGAIPVIRNGQVDEFFQGSGKWMRDNAGLIERQVVESFAEMSNPGIGVFTEKMRDMIQIYSRTSEIYFDRQNIYLIAG